MDLNDIQELKIKFDKIILKYKFSEQHKMQALVDYILSQKEHSAEDFASHFGVEIDEAHILLKFFQKGLEFQSKLQKE